MTPIKAEDVSIEFKVDGVYQVYGCADTCSIDTTTETKSVKTIGDGYWAKSVGQKNSYKVSLGGLIVIDTDFGAFTALEYQRQITPVEFRILFSDSIGNTRRIKGVALVTETNLTAGSDGFAEGSVNMDGFGAFEIGNPADDCFASVISIMVVTHDGHRYIRITNHTGTVGRYDYEVDSSGFLTTFTSDPITDLIIPDDLSGGVHSITIIPYCEANDMAGTTYSDSFTVPSIYSIYGRINGGGPICSEAVATYYTNEPFGLGVIVYTDIAATIPLTGSTSFVDATTGIIYNINTSTGEIVSITGVDCTPSNVPVTVILGNDAGTICTGSGVSRYTSAGFAPGATLYTTALLSTPVTGFAFVVAENQHIYNLNTSTGVIGSDTGSLCGVVTYGLHIDKQVSADLVTVRLTNSGTSVDYVFNENQPGKDFPNVMTSGLVYDVRVTITTSGRPNAPISIENGAGTVVSSSSGTTILTAFSVNPYSTGITGITVVIGT